MSRLRVTEIFHSLQGESATVGLPTVFIRLTGCPLRCLYCDTTYAFKGGEWLGLEEIMGAVAAYSTPYVTVTGGEPLAQGGTLELLQRLCDSDRKVSLETSGALDLSGVDSRVVKVMDLKSPGSGECERNLFSNLQYLGPEDQLKFVLCDRADYEWAREQIRKHSLAGRCQLLFSPVEATLAAADLAQWILEDQLPVRFQIQLHRYLWGDESGR